MDKHSLDGDRVFVIRGFLTLEECQSYVTLSEQAGDEDATISPASGAVMAKHIRDNARLVVDNSSLADEWWRRAEPFLPQHIQQRHAVGFNERFRFYRYEPGQRFAQHFDGYFSRESAGARDGSGVRASSAARRRFSAQRPEVCIENRRHVRGNDA